MNTKELLNMMMNTRNKIEDLYQELLKLINDKFEGKYNEYSINKFIIDEDDLYISKDGTCIIDENEHILSYKYAIEDNNLAKLDEHNYVLVKEVNYNFLNVYILTSVEDKRERPKSKLKVGRKNVIIYNTNDIRLAVESLYNDFDIVSYQIVPTEYVTNFSNNRLCEADIIYTYK